MGKVVNGVVSERPKEHASKACEGASPPWVQIPPAPPFEICVKQIDLNGGI